MRRFIPMVGNIYGQLTVVDRNLCYTAKNYHWNCKCTCGNKVIAPGTRLRSGQIKACSACVRTEKWQRENELKQLVQEAADTINACYQGDDGEDVFIQFDRKRTEECIKPTDLVSLKKDLVAKQVQLWDEIEKIRERLSKIDIAEKALKDISGL